VSSEQVDASEGEFEPGGVDRESPGWEPAEAGGFAGADAVLDLGVAAVPDFQELNRATTVGCVGGEDLMTQAVDLVEQGKLRAGTGKAPRGTGKTAPVTGKE